MVTTLCYSLANSGRRTDFQAEKLINHGSLAGANSSAALGSNIRMKVFRTTGARLRGKEPSPEAGVLFIVLQAARFRLEAREM